MLLDLLFGSPPSRRLDSGGDWGGFWFRGWGEGRRRTQAGTVVDEEIALTYDACWCATRILSEAVAQLPFLLYQREDDDGRKQAVKHPLYDLLKSHPNPQMGSMVFREGRTAHQLNWGQGFSEVARDYRGNVEALWPIHPSRVRPARVGDAYEDGGAIPLGFYVVRNPDGGHTALAPEEMLHVPGCLSEDGVWAKGIIAYAREGIGFGLSTERSGATQFGHGHMPRAVAFLPNMREKDQRQHFRREWKEMHGSPDAGGIAILPPDGRIEVLGFTADQAQYLGTRAFNVKVIARFYRVPVYMLQEFENASARASVEAQGIEFVVYSLLPLIRRWEEQVALKLLTPAERKEYFAEFLVSGLLRGDLKSRMEAYRIAVAIGVLTVNECRRLENLRGIGPAGDQNLVQLNMGTLQALQQNGGLPPDRDLASEIDEEFELEPPGGATAGAADETTRRWAAQVREHRAGKKSRRQGRTLPKARLDFNPDQPRDPDGKFGSGGGYHEVTRDADGTVRHQDGTANPELTARAKALRVPPAWTGLKMSADPENPLQATGKDVKGRAQYLYSAAHSEAASAEKFARVRAFVDELPSIDRKMDATFHGPDGPQKEAAAALFTVRRTGFRIGSERDTKTEHEAKGASTLTADEVKVNGDKVSFDFIGKKGVNIKQEVHDPELAAMLAPRVARGGKLFDTDDSKVRDYLHSIDGPFKVKDMRTVVAAETALKAVKDTPAPANAREYAKARNAVGDAVSAKLGNTRSVALASYTPPEVFAPWEAARGARPGKK